MLNNFWKSIQIISVITLIFYCNSIYSQLNTIKKIEIKEGFDDVKIDHHGYIYQVQNDNLIKRDHNGKEIYRYSNKLLGQISQIDISNPLRPLLFYKDQGIIAVLDNTLSQQKHTISLNEIGLYQAKCIANSNFDNGIWLYDIDINEIIKINSFSQISYRSGNLSVLLDKMSSSVVRLIEKNRKLYAITENEIFILDQFGTLIKTIPISASNGFLIDDKVIICYDGQYIKTHEILNFKTDTIKKSNDFLKIIGYPNQIIGISKNYRELIHIHSF